MPETPSTPLWTADEIAQATSGRRHGPDFVVDGVAFDSREIEPGKLFVALKGARDGHEFAGTAFETGAAGALVEREVEGGPCIQVADTLRALEAMGQAARLRAPARRAAVTGSVGKTSVTQAIKAGLDLAGRAHASVKSYNNHIGVPLTLARMPRDTERAVFEIGMNAPGEIAPLSQMVRPHVACVTTVGPVHIEACAEGEAGVAREKAAIFEGLEPGGLAVIKIGRASCRERVFSSV
jgi:UDP-N-acetylmuramoyl-tripeptide--D-alanyl-D-alanine ligase